jgi:hypothetical protein
VWEIRQDCVNALGLETQIVQDADPRRVEHLIVDATTGRPGIHPQMPVRIQV